MEMLAQPMWVCDLKEARTIDEGPYYTSTRSVEVGFIRLEELIVLRIDFPELSTRYECTETKS